MGIITDSLGVLYNRMEDVLGVVEVVADVVADNPKLAWMGLEVSDVKSAVELRQERAVAHQQEWEEFLLTHPHMACVQPESWEAMRRSVVAS